MFEALFICAPLIERHLTAPLVEERVEYLRHLEKLGGRRDSLRKLAANLLRLVRLGADRGEARACCRGGGGSEEVVAAGLESGIWLPGD